MALQIGKPIGYSKRIKEELGKTNKKLSKRELIQIYPQEEFAKFKHCLIKQMQMIIDICNAHNVRYRVDCGTLLGLYREGDLIFPDFDNDMGICMEDINYGFLQDLAKLGLFRDISTTMYWGKEELFEALHTNAFYQPKVLKIKDQTKTKRFFGGRIPITTDLFFWIEHEGQCYSNLYSEMEMLQSTKNVFPLVPTKTKYGTINMVANPERYLADMYGDDWRIPNPAHRDIPGHVRGLKKRQDTGEIKYNFVTKETKVDTFVLPKDRTIKY